MLNIIIIDQIHIPDTYVRNFYFFRRNFYPQLNLKHMDSKDANKLLERAVGFISIFFKLLKLIFLLNYKGF